MYVGVAHLLPIALLVAVGLAAGAVWLARACWTEVHRKRREAAAASEQIRAGLPRVFAMIVRPHRESLARKRRILVKRDGTGALVLTRWLGELSRFYRDTVLPEVNAHFLGIGRPDLVTAIADEAAFLDWFLTTDPLHWVVEDFAAGRPEPAMGPIEFEAWCRKTLLRAGWNARVAPAGASQAATILADRESVSLALQCRLSAAPVGGKAVQEALAACRLYQCRVAAVVSNHGFAPLARSLAQSGGVCLLHHSELDGLQPEDLLAAVPKMPGAPPAAAPHVVAHGQERPEDRRNQPARVFGRR